jgi:TRAP-type C4-dicarboxylate transport system permease small subunit
VLERLMKALERLLALAFVFAVLLNFANVIGRYGFGRSINGADEVQVYIMVAMAFLGAAVVASRRGHLRMDVLAKMFPEPIRIGLRYAELAAIIGLAGFTVFHSYRYAAQMAALGRASDMAGIPMWIPHGTLAVGFGLIGVIAVLELLERR